ncbi:MAG: hypothetical protein ACRDU5_05090 [Mycobacterium sp.]
MLAVPDGERLIIIASNYGRRHEVVVPGGKRESACTNAVSRYIRGLPTTAVAPTARFRCSRSKRVMDN